MRLKMSTFLVVYTLPFLLIMSCKDHAGDPTSSGSRLLLMRQVTENRVRMMSERINIQLNGFAKAISSDRDFSMKLFVENNRQAPEVADFAARYMNAMGFSILEISDPQDRLLSCAQLTADAGASISDKASSVSDKPVFINDNLKNGKALTLQARISFKILDSTLYCGGGFTADSLFAAVLSPCSGFRTIIKNDTSLIGGDASITDINDSIAVINGKNFRTISITLPFAGSGRPPVLYIIDETSSDIKQ
jgi:hypothetical protein